MTKEEIAVDKVLVISKTVKLGAETVDSVIPIDVVVNISDSSGLKPVVDASLAVRDEGDKVASISEESISIEVAGVVFISSVNDGDVSISVAMDVNGPCVLAVISRLLAVDTVVSNTSLESFGVVSVGPAL